MQCFFFKPVSWDSWLDAGPKPFIHYMFDWQFWLSFFLFFLFSFWNLCRFYIVLFANSKNHAWILTLQRYLCLYVLTSELNCTYIVFWSASLTFFFCFFFLSYTEIKWAASKILFIVKCLKWTLLNWVKKKKKKNQSWHRYDEVRLLWECGLSRCKKFTWPLHLGCGGVKGAVVGASEMVVMGSESLSYAGRDVLAGSSEARGFTCSTILNEQEGDKME